MSSLLLYQGAANAQVDIAIINGKILTVDQNFSIQQAIAIKDDRIVAVGSNEQIKALTSSKTEIIDVKGKTVAPGFIDGHAHMDREGLKRIPLSLDGVTSIAEVLDRIETEVSKRKPGEWIVTMPLGNYPNYGVSPEFLKDNRYPDKHDLDKVSPDNPVFIKPAWYYWTGHEPVVSVANSAALELAGIDAETVSPHDGLRIVKDENGLPTGVFEEMGPIGSVEHSLMKIAPRFTEIDRLSALRKSMTLYNKAGTTSIYEGHGIAPEVIQAYKTLHKNGEMTVRSYLVKSPTWDRYPQSDVNSILQKWSSQAGGIGIGDGMLKIGGIYAEMVSSKQDYVRRRNSTYTGWAGQSVDSALPLERGTLEDIIIAANLNNVRVNAITYSSSSLDEHMAAFEKANQQSGIKDKRFVIEHLSFVTDENVKKIRELGIIPTVLPGSMVWLNGLTRTQGLEQEMANTYVPLKTFVDSGIKFSIGTDNVPYNQLHSIGAAVTRMDAETGQVSSPDQRISRQEALRAATIYGAYLSFEEKLKGSIEVAKYADIVVLSDDYMTVPADKIRDIKVELTMVGGKIVYKKSGD